MENEQQGNIEVNDSALDSNRKRARIKYTPVPIEKDDLAFTKNLCSNNARQIADLTLKVTFDLWYDKHYHDRHQHGDDYGKRDGIEPEIIEALILKSLSHLLLYSSTVRGFKFVNYKESSDKPARVIVQENIATNEMLNIVIEVHYVASDRFEITVKTAMQTDSFRIQDGQYAIQFDGDSSTLCKQENRKLISICTF